MRTNTCKELEFPLRSSHLYFSCIFAVENSIPFIGTVYSVHSERRFGSTSGLILQLLGVSGFVG